MARRLLANTNLLIMDVVAASMRIKGMTTDDAWILCEERCAEFMAEGCIQCKHCSVPPQLRERPIPPEECIHFKRKGE